MKYTLTIAALLAACAAVPAQAQDLTGFRIEGRVGWDRPGATLAFPNPDYDEDDDDSEEFLTASGKESEITYGGEVGYDFQLGSGPVIGAYAGVDFSEGGICAELVEDDLACTGIDRTFTLGARAGIPLGRSALIYVKGGYSRGKLGAFYDPDLTDNDDDEPGDTYSYSKSKGGFHAGGGVEVGIAGGLYGKLEYVYIDYGKRSYLAGTDADDPSLRVGTDRHQVMAGIGFRF